MPNILVLERDAILRSVLCTVLTRSGYTVLQAETAAEAADTLRRTHIDLLTADLLLPETDALRLIRRLRDDGRTFPILLTTACDRYEDKRAGFEAGADDCMVKPIQMNELLLRIRALLRRARISDAHILRIGSLQLDRDALTAARDGAAVQLPQKEFLLLFKLLSCPEKIFTRAELMDEIWGVDSETDRRTVDVHINRLRERFKDCRDFEIVTVRALGYKGVRHDR